MNDEQINEAIAEACGIVSKDQWGSLYKTPRGILRDCPDYCNDLNAMHEAEKTLNHMTATARERAEAFLRTLGKWEETK